MRRITLLLLAQLLLAVPVLASFNLITPALATSGVHFKATTTFDGPNTVLTTNEDGDKEDMEVVRTQTRTDVEGWASGDSIKIVFVDSNDPAIHIGSAMLSTDGGATFVLLNPENSTYAKARFDGLGRASDAAGKKLAKWLKTQPKDLSVTPGGAAGSKSVAGVSGKAHSFTTTFETKNRLPGSKHSGTTTINHQLVTVAGSSVLASWLTLAAPTTGHKSSDESIMEAYGISDQIALYSNAEVVKGKDIEVERYVREVTEYAAADVPASTFEIPADYKKTNRLWSRIKPGKGGIKGLFKKDDS